MILGVGIDICDITRIERRVKKLGSHFYSFILTENEIKQSKLEKNFIISLTSRYAAKEAFYKAFNMPNQKFIVWKDIEILRNKQNIFDVNLSAKTEEILKDFLPNHTIYKVNNSISVRKEMVICSMIISYYNQ